MTPVVPHRLHWAVDGLALSPDDSVLEIGCGRGLAVALAVEALAEGSGVVTGIDRSAHAIGLALARNRAAVESGRAVLRTSSLEEFDPGSARWDVVFAVNVNAFWLPRAAAHLERAVRLAAAGGRVHLCYEPPAAVQADRVEAGVLTAAKELGLDPTVEAAGLPLRTLLRFRFDAA